MAEYMLKTTVEMPKAEAALRKLDQTLSGVMKGFGGMAGRRHRDAEGAESQLRQALRSNTTAIQSLAKIIPRMGGGGTGKTEAERTFDMRAKEEKLVAWREDRAERKERRRMADEKRAKRLLGM